MVVEIFLLVSKCCPEALCMTEVVLIHLFMTKTKKEEKEVFLYTYEVVPGCHHSFCVVIDKQRDPSRGLSLRTCGEATMAREHLDYKY